MNVFLETIKELIAVAFKMQTRIIACLIVLLICFPFSLQAEDIVIGSINENPKEEMEVFLPFALYLGQKLSSEVKYEGRVVVAGSMKQMADYLKTGRVDLYIDSPYPILNVANMSGGKFFLRRWKSGIKEYHSVIFTRVDSTVNALDDLYGKLIAFEEPWSSSSYFLPKHSLARKHLTLFPKENFRSSVGTDEIGYVFSNSDRNTMFWVMNKRVAAGAMSVEKMKKHAKVNIENIKIIHSTFSIPRHVVMHKPGIDPDLLEKIKIVLTEMHTSEEGRAVLKQFEDTAKFDILPNEAFELLESGMEFMMEYGHN